MGACVLCFVVELELVLLEIWRGERCSWREERSGRAEGLDFLGFGTVFFSVIFVLLLLLLLLRAMWCVLQRRLGGKSAEARRLSGWGFGGTGMCSSRLPITYLWRYNSV
jgi:hypothetical protein